MRASHFFNQIYFDVFFSRVLLLTLRFFFRVELWLANFPGKEQNKSAKRSRSIAKLAVDVSPKC